MINQDEIYTATEIVRTVLNKIKNQEIKKALIVKNNKFEAVMISMSEFERLEKAVELLKAVYAKRSGGGE